MDKENTHNTGQIKALALHWFVGVIGLFIFVYSFYNMEFSNFGGSFLIIVLIAIVFGSRISLYIQPIETIISVVDVFIFIVLMLFGIEAAICLTAIETYVTSCRSTNKTDFRIFNTGILTISLFVAVKLSELLFDAALNLSNGINLSLILALLLVVLTFYLVNTTVVSISQGLRANRTAYSIWKEYYVWTFWGFLAHGSIALIAANAIQTSGMFSFILILPIIGVIYFGSYSQQEKLQLIREKAQQSEKFLIEITESEERFRSAFSNAPIGMALVSPEGLLLQVNQSLCDTFGYNTVDFVVKNFRDLIHPDDLFSFNNKTGLILQGKEISYRGDLRYFNSVGKEIWTYTCISSANDSQNSRLIFQIQDITARRKAEEKLRHDAFYDSLTDLANRTMLMKKLNEAITKAKSHENYSFAIIFVDLDRFKLINDSIGHSIGDKLLVAVSRRLKKCLPLDSTLARLGSDEFFILLENKEIEDDKLENLVNEIQSQISLDYGILGHQIAITASIGIVFYDKLHQTAEDVLRDADTALHLAKVNGRSKYVYFDQQMRDKATNQMQLEKDLQRAVEKSELYLVYQPILSLADRKMVGFEALVRWNHPKIGFVSPLEFIPLAEENGTIVQIGEFVLDESCRQLKEWQNSFSDYLPISISVNVSSKQLLQKNLFAFVVDTLEKYKLKPEHLKLEITESVVVENSEIVKSILRQFRALGVKLSMDDFGTGYSSLSYLHRLPINTLKIDRSFVSQMTSDGDSVEIVKTITLLAKNLSLDVVAEGIETEEQLQILLDLSCEYGQGYLFAKPLNSADAKSYFENNFIPQNIDFVANDQNQSSSLLH
jgi:diguanylate cyclase (GGDEF)-like protein/PAS domain S-box-containing protein